MLFLVTMITDACVKGAAVTIAEMRYGRAARRLMDNAARAGYRGLTSSGNSQPEGEASFSLSLETIYLSVCFVSVLHNFAGKIFLASHKFACFRMETTYIPGILFA